MLRSEAMKQDQIKTLMHINENEHIRTINKKYLKAYNKFLVNETTFIHKQHYESVRTVYNIKVNKITIKDRHFLSKICRTNKLYIQDNKTTLFTRKYGRIGVSRIKAKLILHSAKYVLAQLQDYQDYQRRQSDYLTHFNFG